MTARRPLIESELAAAAALTRYAKASGKGLQAIAEEVGVSPAALGHWARGEIPVPLRRVGKLARAIACDPREISVEWSDHVAPYLDSAAPAEVPVRASQPARLEAATIRKAVRLIERTLTALAVEKFDPSSEIDSELLALAIEEVADQRNEHVTDAQVLAFVQKVSTLGKDRGSKSKARANG